MQGKLRKAQEKQRELRKWREKEAEAIDAQLDSALSHWSDPAVR